MNSPIEQLQMKYASVKLLDEETINMLNEYASGSPEIVQDIIDSFEPEASKLLGEIKEAQTHNDVQKLQKAIHSLSGISGAIGAARLRRVATDAENAIKAGNIEEGFNLTQVLIVTYDELIALLKEM